jgi:hypothetical protein
MYDGFVHIYAEVVHNDIDSCVLAEIRRGRNCSARNPTRARGVSRLGPWVRPPFGNFSLVFL